MKKTGILNREISGVVASMGHRDALVIADAGLPVPPETRCIDLALTCGLPPFLETVRVILSELQVEEAVVAEEMLARSPQVYDALVELLGDVPITHVPHEILKERTRSARAVIRTGECTPYANVILISGVIF